MRYFKKTWKNKILALFLAGVGYLSALITGDGTAFVFLLIIAVPLFFAKRNHINGADAKYYIDENGEIHRVGE
jgi:hypothetical protein